MNKRQEKTLDDIYNDDKIASIKWSSVISLLRALGAIIQEREGSRVCVKLNSCRAVFHKPHPEKELCRAAVRSLREFLTSAGVK